MYDGFLAFGGTEIGNADRVQSYARNRSAFGLRQNELHDGLHVALGEEPYRTPLLDEAPWVDENDPATHRFLGVYPLEVKGTSDSTRTQSVIESIVDGGSTSEGRNATREMRYSALAVGEDDLAAEAGLAWLRAVAVGDQCGMHGSCGSSDLSFFLDKPDVCGKLYSTEIDWSDIDSANLGAISPGADLVYRFPATRHLDTPIRGGWAVNTIDGDGVELSWGLMDIDSSDVLEEIQRPLLLQRTNLLSNPSFQNDLSGIAVTSGAAALTRNLTGGVDGKEYARAQVSDGSVVRTNWVRDPRFDLAPELSPWRTNGTLSVAPPSDALGSPVTPGVSFGRFATSDPATPVYAEFTLAGPVRDSMAPLTTAISLYLSTTVGGVFTITVTDNLGALVHSQQETLTAGGWSRRAVVAMASANYVVRVTAPAAVGGFALGAPLAERASSLTLPNPGFETAGPAVATRTNLFPDPLVISGADQWGGYYSPVRTFETVTGPDGTPVRAYVTTTNSWGQGPNNFPEGMATTIARPSVGPADEQITVAAYLDVRGPAGSRVMVGGRTSQGEGNSGYTHTFTGGWDRVGVTYQMPASTTAVGIQVNTGTKPEGYRSERFEFRRLMIEVNPPADAPYFDPTTLPAGDFTYGWDGVANASTSSQRALSLPGVTSQNPGGINDVQITQSSEWAVAGRSARVTPLRWGSDTGISAIPSSDLLPGKTYVAAATVRLRGAQAGNLHPRARSVFFTDDRRGWNAPVSSGAPNAEGAYPLGLVFTVHPYASWTALRLYNGAPYSGGDVWWDSLGVYEIGDYFDGSAAYDGIFPGKAIHRWLGAANASVSERRDPTGTYLNAMPNCSFEAAGGIVALRTNRMPYPDEPGGGSFGGGAGSVATLSGSGIPGGPDRFVRKTWTTASTSIGNTGVVGRGSFAVTPGETITVSGYLRTSSTTRKSAARAKISWVGGEGDMTSDFITLVPGVWTRTSVTRVVPAGITQATAVLSVDDGVNWAVGDTLDGTGFLAEAAATPGTYFDGSTPTSGDRVYRWTGAVGASASQQIVTEAVSVSGPGSYVYQSSEWSIRPGTKSLRITPQTASQDTFASMAGDAGGVRLGIKPGTTYTAIAAVRLAKAQTGTLDVRARTIMLHTRAPGAAGHVQSWSAAAPNAPGEYELRFVFTTPPALEEAFIRLYNGASVGNGDVWWDDFALIEGNYSGPYFDGSTPTTTTAPGDAFYVTGEPNSPSRLVTGTRAAYQLETSPVVGRYGPMVGALSVRSGESSTLTASLVSTDDGTVLSTRTLVVGDTWERISLVTATGRSVRIRLQAVGRLDVDQMIVENASVVYDYFDGNTPAPGRRNDIPSLAEDIGITPTYVTKWLGTPGNSQSRTTYEGGLYTSADDSRVRPFLRAVYGSLPSVQFAWALLREITLDEQLDPYARRFHDVSVVEGPIVVDRYRMDGLSVIRFSMILVAEQPFVYGRTTEVELDPWWNATPVLYSTPPLVFSNYYPNPINLGSALPTPTGGGTASLTIDSRIAIPGLSNLGNRTRRITRTSTASSDSASLPYVVVPKGAELTYASVWVRVNRTRQVTLTVQIDGALGESSVYQDVRTVTAGEKWTRLGVAVTSPNAIGVQMNVLTPAVLGQTGDWIETTATQVNRTSIETDPEFFYGTTPATVDYTYGWAGVAHNSASVRTERTAAGAGMLVDPSLTALPAPPKPPAVGTTFPIGTIWRRVFTEIPADAVELWSHAVPTVTITTKPTSFVRNARLRFYANPFGYDPKQIDPESYCGEIVVSYVPGDTEFVVDAVSRSATAKIGPAAPLVADQNVLSSDGGPVNWPELTCGVAYVVTLDAESTGGTFGMNYADITIELTRRE